jgi:ligand-binding sensor domain-containing protein/signal transduction histidine kinase
MLKAMNKLLPLLILFILLPVLSSHAQTYPFRTYSIESGLSESVAHTMIQDQKGYIWIGTGYGLNRFDGIRFRNYYMDKGLLDNRVQALFEDNRGRLWIGTDSGVNIMQGDSIRTLPELDPLRGTTILSIFQDSKGDIWIGTDGDGVWLYNSRNQLIQYSLVHGLAGDRVRQIDEDNFGVIWFATRDGLSSLSDGNFRSFTVQNGLPDNRIRDIQIDDQNRLWIASRSGLSIFDGETFRNYDMNDGLIDDRIQTISLTGNGSAWMGTEEGVSFFDGAQFVNYTTNQGLSNIIVYSSIIDREGNVWFGTLGGGINVFLGDYLMNYTVDEGLPNNVITNFTEDEAGNIWISTYGGGIVRYDGNQMSVFSESDGLIDNKVYSLFADSRNRIWIGTSWGISIYENGSFSNLTDEMSLFRRVRAIHENTLTGEYWVATYGEGLIRIYDSGYKRYTTADGLTNQIVMAIAQDREGRLWFATYGGVAVLEDGEFTIYTIEDGLPSNGVIHVFIDHADEIWFSTFNGIARFNNGDIKTYQSTFGLSQNIAYFMFQDDDLNYWIGSNTGVINFDKEKYHLATSELDRNLAFRVINREQGLIANEMNASAVLKDSKGTIWLGSVEGVSRFFPEKLKKSDSAPGIQLEEVVLAGKEFDPKSSPTVRHDRNFLQFEFMGLSYEAPNQILYEYRLRGLDSAWQKTYSRSVRYPSLPPNQYRFEVRAINSAGVASIETAYFDFVIRPPFWLQWWFFVLLALLLASVFVFIYNYLQVRRLIEMERVRVQIASDLHDDVGTSLTELALQTDFLRTGNLADDVKKTLEQIGEQSRKIVTSLDDIVWSIDARNDSTGDLTDRVQDYVNSVLSYKPIVVEYDFSDLNMEVRLPVDIKENLYLIFKEAVNNIAKHSSADKVAIMLKMKSGQFRLVVHDNGMVPDNGRKSGQGLHNINMRAKRIGAKAIIDTSNGFRVEVEGSY